MTDINPGSGGSHPHHLLPMATTVWLTADDGVRGEEMWGVSVGPCGDASGDGVVNVVDSLYVSQYTVGLRPALPNPQHADVSQNGVVDVVDSLFISQYVVGLRPSLACPLP